MWTYVQRSGDLVWDGRMIARGYSGFGVGKNVPDMDNIHGVGPIPRGRWLIQGPPEDTDKHGPYILRLVPEHGTQMHGRSGFLIHGDSLDHPGTASNGCIVLPHWARQGIWTSGDHHLDVVPEWLSEIT